jgi:hypothetical protein
MSNQLVGVTRAGDFVHSSQEMASKQDFKNVSKLWYDKTKSISEGIDAIQADAKNRFDVETSASNFSVELSGTTPILKVGGKEYKPTDHAWKQMCLWFGVPQTFYNSIVAPIVKGKKVEQRDAQDAQILVDVFQNGHRRIEKMKPFMFRLDNSGNCRAMMTDKYTAVDNVWYLETLADLFKEIGGEEPRLSHWRGNSDTIFGNLLIPDTCRAEKDSDYGGMISIGNCEIGKRRLSQYPSIFRAICMNGCIWDQVKGAKVNKVHRGEIDLKQLRTNIAMNIHSQIPLMPEAVTRFLSTRERKIGSVALVNVFALLSIECKFNKLICQEVVTQYSTHEQNNLNLFGIINAITRAGQKFSPEVWVEMDTLAGDMLSYSTNVWESFLNRAKALDKDMINKALYVD